MSTARTMSSAEQIERWVLGHSVHRLIPGVVGGECCPDFSCCKQSLLASFAERVRYAAAHKAKDERTRATMLALFLGRLVACEPSLSSSVVVVEEPTTVTNVAKIN